MSTLAERQLAAWQEIARGWPVEEDGRVARCAQCWRGIRLLKDLNGVAYHFAPDEMLSMTVLHLRNYHANLDPDRPGRTL